MNGNCHCRRVTISVPGTPDYLNVCNCTLCTRVGGIWGYYPLSGVTIDGETSTYVRADEAEPFLGTHFCGRCGTTTHWSPLAADAPDRMGVNMALFDPDELIGIEIRYPDGRNDFPDERRFYREPAVFDATCGR